MIIYTSQINAIEDVEKLLEKYRVKPVAIRGTKVNFYWPPQPTGVPVNLLKYFPPDMYVVFRGKNQLIIVP
ncbi:hypothetical protein PAE2967 [Pyrobaculum aerophilum str. IM2]|uniref:Uncharacterized protein n=2 Tax=Pyrobaculum aerophilum TaxID=13773 RepID=Q8ZU35_PYRAE|nr:MULTISPECIES: hypothetical protein [Pyrobaculum]AAL64573.1 hypothetical protein PAE2967 [Pyrobaculum aerophilum str. IM2]HII47417.1 hypothetical protein [Pyrobaculum aerophilum]